MHKTKTYCSTHNGEKLFLSSKSCLAALTGWWPLIKMRCDFSQRVPSACVDGEMNWIEGFNFLLQFLVLPDFLTDGGFQQAAWRDWAIPKKTVEVRIHRKEHRLKSQRYRKWCIVLACFLPTLRTSHIATAATLGLCLRTLISHPKEAYITRYKAEKIGRHRCLKCILYQSKTNTPAPLIKYQIGILDTPTCNGLFISQSISVCRGDRIRFWGGW